MCPSNGAFFLAFATMLRRASPSSPVPYHPGVQTSVDGADLWEAPSRATLAAGTALPSPAQPRSAGPYMTHRSSRLNATVSIHSISGLFITQHYHSHQLTNSRGLAHCPTASYLLCPALVFPQHRNQNDLLKSSSAENHPVTVMPYKPNPNSLVSFAVLRLVNSAAKSLACLCFLQRASLYQRPHPL